MAFESHLLHYGGQGGGAPRIFVRIRFRICLPPPSWFVRTCSSRMISTCSRFLFCLPEHFNFRNRWPCLSVTNPTNGNFEVCFALEDQFWSCLSYITSMKRGQWHVLNMFWSLSDVSLSLYSFLALILAQKSDKEGEAKFYSKLILSSWNINKMPSHTHCSSFLKTVTLDCYGWYIWAYMPPDH